MVLLFGPNTSRSLTGRVVDAVTNPLSLVKAGGTATAVRGLQPPARVVVVRARQFEAINDKYNAADPYARTRSLYFQGRAGRINARVGQQTVIAPVTICSSPFLRPKNEPHFCPTWCSYLFFF